MDKPEPPGAARLTYDSSTITYHEDEVDGVVAGEADQSGDIGGADGDVLGQSAGAGVAGGGVDLGGQG